MATINRNTPAADATKQREEAMQLLKKQRSKIKAESESFTTKIQQTAQRSRLDRERHD